MDLVLLIFLSMTKLEFFLRLQNQKYSIEILRNWALQFKHVHWRSCVEISTIREAFENFLVWDFDYLGILNDIDQHDIKVTIYGDDQFPTELYFMKDPPVLLFYMGSETWKNGPMVSVVGSREPQLKSLVWIEDEFSLFLKATNAITVSGGARGIDQKIHLSSLRLKLPTIVVIPSGLLQMYPEGLKSIKNSIIEYGGCFISEYLPRQRMNKYYFHERNRLISAFGCLTLIIEAKIKSGSMMTARLAADDGRPVLTLPGFPSENAYAGNLQLIYDGAQMVRCMLDLEQLFCAEIIEKTKNHLLIESITEV